MESKIDIVFVDIDWTIFDHSDGNHVFDFESINALNELRNKGVKVFICTARAYHSVKQIGILDYLNVDGLILSNGALIIINDKVIYQNTISKDKMIQIAELALAKDINLEVVEAKEAYLIKEVDQNVLNLYTTYQELIPEVKDYHLLNPIALLLFAPIEYDEYFKSNLPLGITYERFHPFGVDIIENIQEKGEGVKRVLKYFNISKDKSISFGDDYGDISMFKETGKSYCMSNGKEEAKSVASEIIPDVSHQGVKETLKKFYL